MKAYSYWGASLLSAIIIGASSGLAQILPPSSPPPLPPPPTNHLAVVEIVTPHDGTMLLAPVDLHICAVAAYFTDAVASVEFFAGTNVLGVVTNSPFGLGGRDSDRPMGSYFCLTWSNVRPGAYALEADRNSGG